MRVILDTNVLVAGLMVSEGPPHQLFEAFLSDRFTGPKAVTMRQQPVPHAYRVFFRHVGIDPDVERTPIEDIAVERMRAGGFKSRNIVDDALLIATLETSVPVYAFDAARVGEVGLRLSAPGESLGGEGGLPLSRGQVLIAGGTTTGGVLTEEDVDFVCDLAHKHDLLVVSDEIYSQLVYGFHHVSPLSRPGMREHCRC